MRKITFIISFKFIVIISLVSCSVQETGTSKSDLNNTDDSDAQNKLIDITRPIVNPELDLEKAIVLDALIDKKLSHLVAMIEKSIPKPVKFDYQRIETEFSKILLESNQQKQNNKYQFICDENERWIYRCNMESGEIECFSMSSNKLRLLSSVK